MTITVNGTEIQSDDPKVIAGAIRKAKAEEAKANQARVAAYGIAKAKATEEAYHVLANKARLERLTYLTFYPASKGGNWAPFRTGESGKLQLDTAPHSCEYDPYGYRFHGAVAGCSGIAVLVFLQDKSRPDVIECLAIASQDGEIACVDVPGVTPDDFSRDKN